MIARNKPLRETSLMCYVCEHFSDERGSFDPLYHNCAFHERTCWEVVRCRKWYPCEQSRVWEYTREAYAH